MKAYRKLKKLKKLRELVGSFRQLEHDSCEDPYYSCPEHPESLSPNDGCECWLEENNKDVDEALQLIDELIQGEK